MITTKNGIKVKRTSSVGLLYFDKEYNIVDRERFDLDALRQEKEDWIELLVSKAKVTDQAVGIEIVQYCTQNTHIVIDRRYR